MSGRGTGKKCSTCLIEQSLDHFPLRNSGKTRRGQCKTCVQARYKRWRSAQPQKDKRAIRRVTPRYIAHRKRASFRRLYGLTLEEVLSAIEQQNGRCAICIEPLLVDEKNGYQVDHDHSASRFRGILCSGCNRGLSGFRDNPVFLQKAIMYLNQ